MSFEHVHKRACDADEQAASLRGWDQQYEQLSPGRFEGSFEELRLGPVQVFREVANQTVMQMGQPGGDLVSVALVHARAQPGWYCGHRLAGEHLIGVATGGAFDFVASAGMEVLALSVDQAALRQLATQLAGGDAPAPQCMPHLLRPGAAELQRLKILASTALVLASEQAMPLRQEPARRLLALSLADSLLACVGSVPSASERLPGSARSRRQIVARARQYMQAHADEVIAIPDLCQAIGASRRALQYAFEEVMQISPVTYLRTMRLNRVRHALRMGPQAPVGDVATRWGFWHLSRFAADYKALFGELPSATQRAASPSAA